MRSTLPPARCLESTAPFLLAVGSNKSTGWAILNPPSPPKLSVSSRSHLAAAGTMVTTGSLAATGAWTTVPQLLVCFLFTATPLHHHCCFPVSRRPPGTCFQLPDLDLPLESAPCASPCVMIPCHPKPACSLNHTDDHILPS